MIKNPPQQQSPGKGANSNLGPQRSQNSRPRQNGRGGQNQNRANSKGSGPLVAAAAAYASGQKSQAPRIQATRDQSHIIHRELVTSVTGAINFLVLKSLALNPGMIATFPWLATQAIGWEKYHFNSLRFCYYTRTGSTTPGSVLLAPDYDAADSPPLSEAAASAYTDVAEDAPWKNIVCALSKKHMGGEHFIRSGPLAANLDIKTYDVGQLFVCVLDGTPVPWGKLWVEYDVVLSSPQLPPSGGVLLDAAIWNTAAGTEFNPFAGMTPCLPTDTALVTLTATGAITFNKPGRYAVVYSLGASTKNISITMADPSFDDDTKGELLAYDDVPNGSYNFFTHALLDISVAGVSLTYDPQFDSSPEAVLGVVGVYQVPSDQGAFIVNT